MLVIRPYEPTDEAAVRQLLQTETPAHGSLVEAASPSNGDTLAGDLFLVGTTLDERVIATASLRCVGGRDGEVCHLYVDAAHRGRGYGRALMQSLEAQARLRGVRHLVARVQVTAAVAVSTLTSLGYRQADGHEGTSGFLWLEKFLLL